jgi:hypothetical protein
VSGTTTCARSRRSSPDRDQAPAGHATKAAKPPAVARQVTSPRRCPVVVQEPRQVDLERHPDRSHLPFDAASGCLEVVLLLPYGDAVAGGGEGWERMCRWCGRWQGRCRPPFKDRTRAGHNVIDSVVEV